MIVQRIRIIALRLKHEYNKTTFWLAEGNIVQASKNEALSKKLLLHQKYTVFMTIVSCFDATMAGQDDVILTYNFLVSRNPLGINVANGKSRKHVGHWFGQSDLEQK